MINIVYMILGFIFKSRWGKGVYLRINTVPFNFKSNVTQYALALEFFIFFNFKTYYTNTVGISSSLPVRCA